MLVRDESRTCIDTLNGKIENEVQNIVEKDAYMMIGKAYEEVFEETLNKKEKQLWANKVEASDAYGKLLNSRRFHSLQDEEEEDNEEESYNEDMDVDKIYFYNEDKGYVHLSDMRYDIKSKNYNTWVRDDPEDKRCL